MRRTVLEEINAGLERRVRAARSDNSPRTGPDTMRALRERNKDARHARAPVDGTLYVCRTPRGRTLLQAPS
jgi:hypothetical protein